MKLDLGGRKNNVFQDCGDVMKNDALIDSIRPVYTRGKPHRSPAIVCLRVDQVQQQVVLFLFPPFEDVEGSWA